MKSIAILIVTALYLALFNSHGVRAEVDTCVECHKDPEFQVSYIRLYDYYKEWEGSAHELGGVTCVDCHLGDSTATVKEKAHHVANCNERQIPYVPHWLLVKIPEGKAPIRNVRCWET